MESPRRKHSRERALHPQEYLDTHHIPLYLNDVVTLLLRLRPAAPLDFIANYFAEVLNGTHVLLRDFAYISACPHNRWSFVLVIQDSFGRLSPNQELSAHDLLELLRLFCPDFPLELVVDACKLCGDGSGSHPLQDLLHAWRARFYYAEFLERTAEVFQTCDTRNVGHVNRNVLCLTLRQMLSSNASRIKFPCPPYTVFDELIVDNPSVDADIRLLDMQRLLVHTPVVCASLACRAEGRAPLVASPPSSSRGAQQHSAALGRLLAYEMSKESEGAAAASVPRRRGAASKGTGRRGSSTTTGRRAL